MEAWYSVVRDMKDKYEDSYNIQQVTHQIFRDLSTMRIREKVKFWNKMGTEFALWERGLRSMYPEETVQDVLNDNKFWVTTLQTLKKIKPGEHSF